MYYYLNRNYFYIYFCGNRRVVIGYRKEFMKYLFNVKRTNRERVYLILEYIIGILLVAMLLLLISFL